MSTRLSSLGKGALAALATLVLVSSVALRAGAAGSAAPAPAERAVWASSWLADQLVDGDHFEATFGTDTFPDQGLTADAVIAFAASGVADDAAAAAAAWLGQSANTSGYVGDGTTESYAGSIAKLALVAQVRALDPTAFGEDDIDLIARLTAREAPSGRFSDASAFGDFSNVIGQSFAIIVLTRQPSVDPSSDALDLLIGSQCDDGGFDLDLEPAPDTCGSQVDATTFAIQALLAGGRADEAAAALDYLEGVQQGDGGFLGLGTENANSTGLAAQSLRVGGRTAAADEAVAFLATLQVTCDDDEANNGAIAYNAEDGFVSSTAWRATAQAVPGLAGVGLLEASAQDADRETADRACVDTAPPPAVQPTAPPATPTAGTPRFTG
jgi:hypothetical protein